jgi:hypothetical protein
MVAIIIAFLRIRLKTSCLNAAKAEPFAPPSLRSDGQKTDSFLTTFASAFRLTFPAAVRLVRLVAVVRVLLLLLTSFAVLLRTTALLGAFGLVRCHGALMEKTGLLKGF